MAALFCELRTDLMDFVDDWILFHESSSMSSGGVQITGGENTEALQISSILPRSAALAMCRQFQVRR